MLIPRPELLVDPDWLAERLGNPGIRVFDCNLTRIPQPSGPSLWKSGEHAWRQSHIPGAGYLHMIDDLTDHDHPLPFMLPEPSIVEAVMSRFGVADDTTVVLYGLADEWVVHRIWWVLKASNVSDVRVLDGGFKRWLSEKRPVESGQPSFIRTNYVCAPRKEYIANRNEVSASLEDRSVCAINALSADLFRGEGDQVFGRRGHIPYSKNIPANSLIHKETACFRPLEEIQAIFAGHDLESFRKIIPYCGGGIAASTLFFALKYAGFDNVALYDGSLFDWTSDPNAPMMTGDSEIEKA